MKIMAEIKMGSPFEGKWSGGQTERPPIDIAQDYERLGASMISVVTAPTFFGDKNWIKEIKSKTKLRVLRKDFISTTEHLKETVDLGADWVLLIAKHYNTKKLEDLVFYAGHMGLKPIVEVYDFMDISAAALSQVNTVLLTTRNLRNGELEPSRPFKLVNHIPIDTERVIGSGIGFNKKYIRAIVEAEQFDYMLIGKYFMQSEDLDAAFNHVYSAIANKQECGKS